MGKTFDVLESNETRDGLSSSLKPFRNQCTDCLESSLLHDMMKSGSLHLSYNHIDNLRLKMVTAAHKNRVNYNFSPAFKDRLK